MASDTSVTKTISLKPYGINNAITHYQLEPQELHDISVKNDMGKTASSGALAVNTGKFTGRSPLDRFIVKDEKTEDLVWWGSINLPFEADAFTKLKTKITDYLSEKELYVRDSYACADDNYRLNIRVINEYPWSNMFAYNMFLRPTDQELKSFDPEWTILNAPGFLADPAVDGTRQSNFAILSFTEKQLLLEGQDILERLKKVFFLH